MLGLVAVASKHQKKELMRLPRIYNSDDTVLVNFNCPKELLKSFDDWCKKHHYRDRTEALLGFMREKAEEA